MPRAAEIAEPEPHVVMPGSRATAGLVVQLHRVVLHTTRPTDFVDITAAVQSAVHAAQLQDGLAVVMTRHTTTGLLVNEHEPLLLDDLTALFDRLVPATTPFAHDDPARRAVNLTEHERINGHAHARAALLRASETVPVHDGTLQLGRWQRLFFVDFDGGQRRTVTVSMVGRRRRPARRRRVGGARP